MDLTICRIDGNLRLGRTLGHRICRGLRAPVRGLIRPQDRGQIRCSLLSNNDRCLNFVDFVVGGDVVGGDVVGGDVVGGGNNSLGRFDKFSLFIMILLTGFQRDVLSADYL